MCWVHGEKLSLSPLPGDQIYEENNHSVNKIANMVLEGLCVGCGAFLFMKCLYLMGTLRVIRIQSSELQSFIFCLGHWSQAHSSSDAGWLCLVFLVQHCALSCVPRADSRTVFSQFPFVINILSACGL